MKLSVPSPFIWFTLSITLFLPFCLTVKESTKGNDRLDLAKPEFKSDRILALTYFINRTNDPRYDFIATSVPPGILQNLSVVQKIYTPKEFWIITNKETILESQKKQAEEIAGRITGVFSLTETDFFGESPNPTAKNSTPISSPNQQPNTNQPQPQTNPQPQPQPAMPGASSAAGSPMDAAATGGVPPPPPAGTAPLATQGAPAEGSAALSFDDLLQTQKEMTGKPLMDLEILDYIELKEPKLPEIIGLDLKDYIQNSRFTNQLTILEELYEVQFEKIDDVEEIETALTVIPADIVVVGEFFKLPQSSDLYLHIKAYDKDKKKFFFDTEHLLLKDNIETDILSSVDQLSYSIIRLLLGDKPLGNLLVYTDEPDTVVYLDGRFAGESKQENGKSSFEMKFIPFGNHTIEIARQGFEAVKEEIYIHANQVNTLDISLEKIRNSHQMEVLSDPAGGDVYIDMDFVGITPIIVTNLEPGVHRVRIEKEGYNQRNIAVTLPQQVDMPVIQLYKATESWLDPEKRSDRQRRFRNIFVYGIFVSLVGAVGSYYQSLFLEDLQRDTEKLLTVSDPILQYQYMRRYAILMGAPRLERLMPNDTLIADYDRYRIAESYSIKGKSTVSWDDYVKYKEIQYGNDDNATAEEIKIANSLFGRDNQPNGTWYRADNFKNIVTAFGGVSILLAITFQWLELHMEDIEIGSLIYPSIYTSKGFQSYGITLRF